MKANIKDYLDKEYGLLTIKDLIYTPRKPTKAICKCECGNSYVGKLAMIKIGHTSSCGCKSIKTRFKKNTKRKITHDFSNLTEESAYWAGFIFGDGCITSGGLQICLSSLTPHTVKHLEKLSRFIYGKNYVLKYKTKCILQVRHEDVIQNLIKFGIIPNKTYQSSLILPNKYQLDFIRGYFDADGWFTYKRYKHKNGKSYYRNIFGICSYLENNLTTINSYMNNICRKTKKKDKELYSILSSKREDILQIIELLETQNKEICYIRKWNKLWKFYKKYQKIYQMKS